MSEQNESLTDDLGSYSLDDEDQLQPEDTLVDDGVDDILDRGYSPPDQPRGSQAYGVTAGEQAGEESIDQRIRQEEPDPNSAYGAPSPEPDEDDGQGDDEPDAVAAEDDWYGDTEVGDRRAGRLIAPDQGAEADSTHEMVGSDVGIDGAGASAEEAAMHIIDESELA